MMNFIWRDYRGLPFFLWILFAGVGASMIALLFAMFHAEKVSSRRVDWCHSREFKAVERTGRDGILTFCVDDQRHMIWPGDAQ